MTGQVVYAGYGLPAGEAVPDFAVYITGGHIAATGTRAELTAQYPDAPQVGGEGLMMLPGFVNAHDHGRALGTATLGVPDSFLEVWLNRLGSLPTLPPYLAAAWEGLQLAKSGVTSTAHSHNPASWEAQFDEIPPTLRGYADAGLRVAMHPVIVDQNPLVYADAQAFIAALPPSLREQAHAANQPPPLTADDYFDGLSALYDAHHDPDTGRVQVQASPAGGQWCSDDLTLRAVEWAQARNTRVQMHLLETRYQRDYAYQMWGESFIRHLERIGALGEWLTLAHGVWVEDEDIVLLAAHHTGVAHNPSSNLRLRSGVAPLAQFIVQGVPHGIGLDGHSLADDQDYLAEMRLAWTLGNRPGMSEADVSAADCLLAGTRSGAAITFGRGVPLGVLEPGGLADLVLLDWRAVCGEVLPDGFLRLDEIGPVLLRRGSRSHVRHVMMGGEWTLRDGQHTRLDEAALAAQIREALSAQMPRPERGELGPYIRQFYHQWDPPPLAH